jgi:hypothetical protein
MVAVRWLGPPFGGREKKSRESRMGLLPVAGSPSLAAPPATVVRTACGEGRGRRGGLARVQEAENARAISVYNPRVTVGDRALPKPGTFL